MEGTKMTVPDYGSTYAEAITEEVMTDREAAQIEHILRHLPVLECAAIVGDLAAIVHELDACEAPAVWNVKYQDGQWYGGHLDDLVEDRATELREQFRARVDAAVAENVAARREATPRRELVA